MKKKEILFLKESNLIEEVYDEVSLHQAKFAWEYLLSQKKMTCGVVLKTHKILMLKQDLQPDEKGYFRKCDVYIGGRRALNAYEIRGEMEFWCDRVNIHSKVKSPIWKNDHVLYEFIHPFVDGNGRTGRMFMNWQRLKSGLPIKVIFNEDKHDYYLWFKQ